MLFGIMSDVHANFDALKAVIDYANDLDPKLAGWYFLGDAVGYGPDPVNALRMLRENVSDDRWVIGNHDAYLVQLLPMNGRDEAQITIADHVKQLQDKDNDLFRWCQETWNETRANPIEFRTKKICCYFVHAAIQTTHTWAEQLQTYLYPWPHINGVDYKLDVLSKLLTNPDRGDRSAVQIHGHTHVPYAFGVKRGQKIPYYPNINYQEPIQLDEFDALLISPGSVGQARQADQEHHADFGILDTSNKRFHFCKVGYDYEQVTDKMYKRDYPATLRYELMGAKPNNPLWKDGENREHWIWLEWQKNYQRSDLGWRRKI